MNDELVKIALAQCEVLKQLAKEYREVAGKLSELASMRSDLMAIGARVWNTYTVHRSCVYAVSVDMSVDTEVRAHLRSVIDDTLFPRKESVP